MREGEGVVELYALGTKLMQQIEGLILRNLITGDGTNQAVEGTESIAKGGRGELGTTWGEELLGLGDLAVDGR